MADSLMADVAADELRNLLAGLRQSPPRIAPRYFYDRLGSQLFDEITRTPEYYPTRTELSLLLERGGDIAAHIASGSVLVELGSGSADKALALLEHLREPRLYRPIDISQEALDRTTRAAQRARPDLDVSPYCGDFSAEAAYADLPTGAQRLVYFSGSTIGNFERADAVAFLRALRERLNPGDALLLAVDLVKDPAVLHAAYNDAAGVTAAFNRNALRHINARFGANFRPEAFEHRAFYDPRQRRVEMHLVPCRELEVNIAGERLRFVPDAPIHTENSHKFTLDDLPGLARRAGYTSEFAVTDPNVWFAEALFRA
jgi:dimethylhistidine N-methyltransferase